MIQLRDYQEKAVDMLYQYFHHNSGMPCLEAPTGAGKSLIQAAFIKSAIESSPGTRILCLTHQKELIAQNHAALNSYWPQADAGINSASIGRRETGNAVLFAAIQSVHRNPGQLGHFDLVMIDEAHMVPNKVSSGMYRKFLDAQIGFNKKLKVIGLTASPYRLGGGMLTDGSNRLFTDIIPAKAVGMDMPRLIELGYLSPLTTEPVKTKLNTDGVKMSCGDFVASALAKAVDKDSVTAAACNEIISHGQERKSWLIFATSVEHAHHIADYMQSKWVDCRVVTGNTPQNERDSLIAEYKAGEIRSLVSVGVLTTGFDAPQTDLIAFLRPTMSPGLYLQMAGRALRVAPGKSDALVLDFAGNIDRHGPVDDINPPKPPRKREGETMAPLKECPDCFMLLAASSAACPYCGYEFPQAPPKIEAQASTADIMSRRDGGAVRVEPTKMMFSVHQKAGKPRSMRVDYYAGINRVATEWVCLEHGGYARVKAENWWRQHIGSRQYICLDDAIEIANECARLPAYLFVDSSGKYSKIISRGFNEVAA